MHNNFINKLILSVNILYRSYQCTVVVIIRDTIYAPLHHNHCTEPFKVEVHDALYFLGLIGISDLIISIYKRDMK